MAEQAEGEKLTANPARWEAQETPWLRKGTYLKRAKLIKSSNLSKICTRF